MKRIYTFFAVIILLLSLASCSSDTATYTVVKDGISFTVDTVNRTIFDGTHTYQFALSGSSSGSDIKITYPDGSSYWWRTQSSGGVMIGHGGWSDDYDENRYVDGDTLCDVLSGSVPKDSSSGNFGIILILFLIGLFNTLCPQAAWYLEYGWRFKNAEPSDLALGLNRFGGLVALIIAVIMIFI